MESILCSQHLLEIDPPVICKSSLYNCSRISNFLLSLCKRTLIHIYICAFLKYLTWFFLRTSKISLQALSKTHSDLIGMRIVRRKGAALSFVWPSWMFYNIYSCRKAGKQHPRRGRPEAGESVREAPGGREMLGYAYSCRRKTSQPNDKPFILTTAFQCS